MTAPAAAVVGSTPVASTRVASLLSRMTLDERVGQMTQLAIEAVAAAPSRQRAGRIMLDPQRLRDALVGRHVGSLRNVLHAALSPDGWHALLRDVQHVALHETRLGVPVLYGIDVVHGANYVRGGTVFPHNVGLAATFDPALVRRAGEVTAAEAAACALPWKLAPVLDVGRQPLWPRFYETFGEDPHLAATLGAAAVEGSQRTGRVAATMKHYLGYGAPRSGRDRTPAALTEREVREVHLPPFRAAVAAGARALMVSSRETDGEPVHASRHWLTTVLRDELGFRGGVTDWDDVLFLHTRRGARGCGHEHVGGRLRVRRAPRGARARRRRVRVPRGRVRAAHPRAGGGARPVRPAVSRDAGGARRASGVARSGPRRGARVDHAAREPRRAAAAARRAPARDRPRGALGDGAERRVDVHVAGRRRGGGSRRRTDAAHRDPRAAPTCATWRARRSARTRTPSGWAT